MTDEVAPRVKQIQARLGVSQAELATAIGMNGSKLSKSLHGSRRFTSLELARIADIGGTTVDWLLTGAPSRSLEFAARALRATSESSARGQEILADLGQWHDAAHELGLIAPAPALPVGGSERGYVAQANALAAQAVSRLSTPLGAADNVSLIGAIEEAFGVCVVIDTLPDGYDGLSYQDDDFRAIVLAKTPRAVRQRYTLAHEVGHLLWGDASEEIIAEHLLPPRDRRDPHQEKRANVFAASFLMPEREIREALSERTGVEAFPDLVWQFGVSPDSMAWRLFNLLIIDDAEREGLSGLSSHSVARQLRVSTEHASRCSLSDTFRPAQPLVDAFVTAYEQGVATARPLAALLKRPIEEVEAFFDSDGAEGIWADPENQG